MASTVDFSWGSDRFAVRSAEYDTAMTGCTLLLFGARAAEVCGDADADAGADAERTATCAVDVRGGSPGSLMATDGRIDGVLFVGGSTLGFAALAGVYSGLMKSAEVSGRVSWNTIPVVRGGVIFDWAWRQRNGPAAGPVYPDPPLAARLFEATDEKGDADAARAPSTSSVRIGRVGAGCGASCGKVYGLEYAESGGQGFAFWSGDGGADSKIRIAVLTVVNSVGCIVDRAGRVVRGNRSPVDGRRRHCFESGPPSAGGTTMAAGASVRKEDAEANMAGQRTDSLDPRDGATDGGGCGENTTLTCVTVNVRLTDGELRQLARQVHSSMARYVACMLLSSSLALISSCPCSHRLIASVDEPLLLGCRGRAACWHGPLATPSPWLSVRSIEPSSEKFFGYSAYHIRLSNEPRLQSPTRVEHDFPMSYCLVSQGHPTIPLPERWRHSVRGVYARGAAGTRGGRAAAGYACERGLLRRDPIDCAVGSVLICFLFFFCL